MFDEKGERANYTLEILGLRQDPDGKVRLNKVRVNKELLDLYLMEICRSTLLQL